MDTQHNNDNPFKGLSRQELHDQLSRYLLTEKQLKKSISKTIEDYERWKTRLNTARDSGREDLMVQAQDELQAFQSKLGTLTVELNALEPEIKLVTQQIKEADREQQGRISGVDPNGLLSSLESMIGKSTEEVVLHRALKEQEADDLLLQLKAKLQNEKKDDQ